MANTHKRLICVGGKNDIAVRALYYLQSKFPDHCLCVCPNRNQSPENGWQASLKWHAAKLGIPEKSLSDIYPIKELLFLSLQFDRIVKPDRFSSPDLFNIHFSALPAYKGMHSSILPILNDESESGVTLHRIAPGIDTGEIIAQIRFPLGPKVNGRELYQLYLDHAFELFKENIDSLIASNYSSKPQAAVGSTYYSKSAIEFGHLQIDYGQTAWQLANHFRAFHFREYQLPCFDGVDIDRTEILSSASSASPGTILDEDEHSFTIATIDYDLRLHKDRYPEFWHGCEMGDIGQIRQLLCSIPDVNLRNSKGWNGLILATYHHQPEAVSLLLSNGADVNACNFKGTSVLMYAKSAAERTGESCVLEAVLKAGANAAHRNQEGHTVLDYTNAPNLRAIIEKFTNRGGGSPNG